MSKKRRGISWVLSLVLFIFPLWASAHHALEYIEMESYTMPRKGEFLFHLHYDYYVPDEGNNYLDHWELTPGFAGGIFNWLMFDVHTHFAKFGSAHIVPEHQGEFDQAIGMPPFFEAVATSLQFRLTKPQQLPIDAGLVFTYEYPFERSQEYLDGKEVYEATLILYRELGEHRNICANLSYGLDGGEEFWEWAIGFKTPLSPDPHGINAGVEVIGDFDGGVSVLPGIYFPLAPQINFKFGFQFGNEKWEKTRANLTIMYSF